MRRAQEAGEEAEREQDDREYAGGAGVHLPGARCFPIHSVPCHGLKDMPRQMTVRAQDS